jgi:signal transduction histidine kinase
MRRHRSLIVALIVRFALVAGLGIVGTLLAHGVFSPIDLHYELDAIGRRLQSHLGRDADGNIRVAVDPGLERELGRVPGLQLRVVDTNSGKTLFSFGTSTGSGKDEISEMSEWPVGHFELFDDEANRRAYGYVAKLDAPGGADIRMVASRGPAQTRDVVYWLRTELFAELGPYILVATLVAVGVAVLTILQALAPLNRLSAQAQRIVPGDSAARLDEADVPREVLPLVRAVNDTLDRLHRALAQERRFTASAAHELRTPLAAVQARLDALDDGPEILALRRSVLRMSRIVDQLLAVARLESGQVALDDTVDLDLVARNAVAERAPLALAAGKSIELAPAGRPLRLPGNAMALEQALGNLIDNALAVTPPAGVVEVQVQGDGRILVLDRGPGFGDRDPAQLFLPFARGRSAQRSGNGAGLGLAIVRDTALLHGGRVIALARPDGGAVFGIALPIPSP